jgi:hypothetical protein
LSRLGRSAEPLERCLDCGMKHVSVWERVKETAGGALG